MCQVYEFPVKMKKELPKELEERLNKVSKEYVEIMDEVLKTLCGDEPTDEDYESFMEVMIMAYVKSIEKAIDELE